MNIRIITILCVLLLFSGMASSADFDPKHCTTIEELTAQGIPHPGDLISDMSDNRLGHTTQIFVTKLWYRLTPQQKKTVTLRTACRMNIVRSDWNVQFYDAVSGRKLTQVFDGKFVSFEK